MLVLINLSVWICVILSAHASDTGSVSSIQENTRSGLYRQRRQTNCDGFKCRTSGECINEDNYCDGHVDCADGSDETTRCKSLTCPGYLFRCKYGACIDKKKECDGKNDCKDGSDESSSKCTNIANAKCKTEQFRCTSGQCIMEDYKCDGTPQCTDKSDETSATCSRITCPGYTFKCAYGACISRKGLCNGISDCLDNSDESVELCGDTGQGTTVSVPVTPATATPPSGGKRPPPVTAHGSCVLPPKIDNGGWSIWINPEMFDYRPGDRVISGTLLEIKCRSGKLDPSVPQCAQTCPKLESTASTIITCTNRGIEVDCSQAVSHTKARYSCAPFHELSTMHNILYCLDGSWDLTKPSCTAVCGQKNVKIKELIIGGEIVKRGSYPWTVALYRKKDESFVHVCGASLISQRVIVTAAHCVTNREGKKYSEDIYRVAAGKYYRAYEDKRDTDAEFSEIEKIFVYDRYKGSTFDFEADIAVLVAKEAFNTTQFIQRVCVDWDQSSYYESRLLGTNGTVTGWGYTVRGDEPSPILKEISLPYVDFTQCYTAMPDDYKKYVRSDKMCAGVLDKGIGVCEGDSGGGLTFVRHENNRYYLRGIVSVAPQVSGSCNENEYALYTKVSSYIDFIASIERSYRKNKNSNEITQFTYREFLQTKPDCKYFQLSIHDNTYINFSGCRSATNRVKIIVCLQRIIVITICEDETLWLCSKHIQHIPLDVFNFKYTGCFFKCSKNIRFGLHRQRRQVNCDGKNQFNCSSLLDVKPTSTLGEKKPTAVTEQVNCVLPSNIQNGRWKIMGNSTVSNYQPGDRVPTITLLEIECNKGFKLDGSSPVILCSAGTWLPSVPVCVKTCPQLKSTATTIVTCMNKGITVNCSEAVSHTVARFNCDVFHELTTTYNKLLCYDGTWDQPKPVCAPVCGLKNEEMKKLIIGGNTSTVRRGSHPWSVALYRKKNNLFEHVCGASLISAKLILTAAHCVTNREGKKNSEANYRVAAGKYFRAYDDKRDTDAQFSEIEKIFVPERYRGSILDFESDFAVLVAKVPFKTTAFVQRVCVDWNSNANYETRLLNSKGTVVGWGYTVQKMNLLKS
ncbi:hypothetical protein WA026_007439 [Henosepilachna vigintioctopunctata]|uniref:Uncharacterized protein n=1 Tax=Henosepilachna vigintioctopunctata TaxID=420089 RepID=A0AAW1UNC2_9CUCU